MPLSLIEHRINTRDGKQPNPTDVSRGVFGATVGIDRLLKLWDKYDIKTTWFTPAHSLESFPNQIRKIVNKGHEIALHGYTHEFVSTLSEQQQRDVLEKSIQVIHEFTGTRPRGWTAPAWSTSNETIKLLEEFGIVRLPALLELESLVVLNLRLNCRSTITPSCTTIHSRTTYRRRI
jgi:peptidoglycan/xylan/chitin deacetylase (PgdA/CDA1 family)